MSTTVIGSKLQQARIVARAWMDPTFHEKLVANPKEVLGKEGIEVPEGDLRVLVDNADHINLVLSDEPRGERRTASDVGGDIYALLAMANNRAIDDPDYKARLIVNPAAALSELGVTLPDGVTISVHRDSEHERHFVVPLMPTVRVQVDTRPDPLDLQLDLLGQPGTPGSPPNPPAQPPREPIAPTNTVSNVNTGVNVNVGTNVNAITNANAGVAAAATVGAVAVVVIRVP